MTAAAKGPFASWGHRSQAQCATAGVARFAQRWAASGMNSADIALALGITRAEVEAMLPADGVA